LTLDIAKAYPEEAHVKTWQRSITLNRGKNVEISEKYQLKKFIEPFTLNFLTPLIPVVEKAGKIKLQNMEKPDVSAYLLYNAKLFTPSIEKIEITDGRMSRSWGNALQRVVLKSKEKALHGQFKITIVKK
ncbi:MAG: heparinase, partial [Thermotogota bacterium]|nr:heparinase [Thermotogota bacterium]